MNYGILVRFSLILMLAGAGAAMAVPGGVDPLQARYQLEKAKADKMQRLAYAANPELKRIEEAGLALFIKLKLKQKDVRTSTDQYLKDHQLKPADLDRFKLNRVADLLMKITPYGTVTNPKMKNVVLGAIRKGKPVFPADFDKQFPGKRPDQVPPDELMAFYASHLKAEATQATRELNALVKETQIPTAMFAAQQELVWMHCNLRVITEYLKFNTPADLVAQRKLVRTLGLQLRVRKPAPAAGGLHLER